MKLHQEQWANHDDAIHIPHERLDYIIELLEESIYLDDDKLVEKVLAILQHIQSENNFEQYKDDDDWWMGLGDDE
tara:strand:+ start:780 stop:1004 length:225 start_codon:yes stop_codon:yes gene_type:complete